MKLVFLQDTLKACIELTDIKEIIGMCDYTRIPGLPDYIIGIVNVRGKVIPIADLRLCLSVNNVINEKTCIIIVETQRGDLGIIADAIIDLRRDLELLGLKEISSELDFVKGLYTENEDVIYAFDFLE